MRSGFRLPAAFGLLASAALIAALPRAAQAHTTSIGYESAGPGSVTFWYGSYHGGGGATEGSLNLSGGGVDVTVAFDLFTSTRPAGLIDGVTNFFTDGGTPPTLVGTDPGLAGPVVAWQGSTFTGLEAGSYTFTYVPATPVGSFWAPWDAAVLSSMVTLDAAVLGGGGGSDGGVAAAEGAVVMSAGQTQDLHRIAGSNRSARQEAAERGASGERAVSMSRNGPSSGRFSAWATVGGGVVNGDFGASIDTTWFVGQAGLEYDLGGGLAIGLGLGGGTSHSDMGAEALEGDALFVQPYAAFASGPLSGVVSVAYTHTSYDDSTGVIDSGDRFSGSLSAAYEVPLGERTAVSPYGFVAGGWETLDTSGGDDDLSFVTGRAGLELSRRMEMRPEGSLRAYLSAGAEVISASAPDGTVPLLLTDYGDDRIGARVEAGFEGSLSGDTTVFANVFGSGLFSDAPGIGGRIGIEIPF